MRLYAITVKSTTSTDRILVWTIANDVDEAIKKLRMTDRFKTVSLISICENKEMEVFV